VKHKLEESSERTGKPWEAHQLRIAPCHIPASWIGVIALHLLLSHVPVYLCHEPSLLTSDSKTIDHEVHSESSAR
jgi:hypothetical protein